MKKLLIFICIFTIHNAIWTMLAPFISFDPKSVRPGFNVQTTQNLYDAIKQCDSSKACKAIQAGADVNAKDTQAQISLIHIAATFGLKEVVKQLIQKGADIDAQNIYGQNVLHYAVLSNSDDLLCMLMRHVLEESKTLEAFLNIQDVYDHTPLDIAHGYDKRCSTLILQVALKEFQKIRGI